MIGGGLEGREGDKGGGNKGVREMLPTTSSREVQSPSVHSVKEVGSRLHVHRLI